MKLKYFLGIVAALIVQCGVVWAEGPEMNKVYTVPNSVMRFDGNNSYKISKDFFLQNAISVDVTMSGSPWVTLTNGYYGNEKYYDAPYGTTVATYTLEGTQLETAKNGGLYVSCNGSTDIVLTVLNKDANYVAPSPEPGGNGGGGTDNPDPDYEPDYSFQQDTDDDGKLNPDADHPAFGVMVDYKQYPQLTDVPTIYLTTVNTFTFDANTQKSEEYQDATIVIVDKNGKMKQRNETVTFRGRGNSTWNCGSKKKPWRLKFPTKTKLLAELDANYNEINNYADAKSWTLLANVYDKTLMRNALASELGKRYGMEFCPAYRFVDLVINGNYMGTYQVSDHMQVDKNRVNVNSKTGWFVEFCTTNFVEDPYIMVNGNIPTAIKNPETDVVTSSGETTDPQYGEMKNWLGKMWTALSNGANGWDANTKKTNFKAFRDMVDLKSLTGFMMIEDLSGNYDGAMANVYAYKEASDEKLKFGPLWDLDIAFGNYSNLSESHFWEAQSQGVGSLFGQMWKDPYFVKALYENWQKFYNDGKLKTDIVGTPEKPGKIDEIASILAQTQAKNYNTTGDSWRGSDSGWNLGSQVSWCTQGVSSYEAAVSALKTFLNNRIDWIETTYSTQYSNLDCATLDPCTDFGHNDGYVLQADGSYRKGCDVCGTVSETDTPYYQFKVYPESKNTEVIMATSWQPSADKPNSIAVVEAKQEVVEKIEGWNIIAGKKNAEGNLTCKDFRLTDGHPYYGDNKFVATTATYTRSITDRVGTVCLPYKQQSATIEGAKLYHLNSVSSEELVLKIIEPEIEGNASAYVPVVFVAEEDIDKLTFTGENVTVKKISALEPYYPMTDNTDWSFVGTMEKTEFADVSVLKDENGAQQYLYYLSGDTFYRATIKFTCTPFRAYFLSNTNLFSKSAQSHARLRIVTQDELGIQNIINDDQNWDNAIHVSSLVLPLPTGKYIINGRNVIINE